MTWHKLNMSPDGKVRGPMDSPQWKWIATHHADFEDDAKNLHLGLCADGVNPFAHKKSIVFVRPILIFNYNG